MKVANLAELQRKFNGAVVDQKALAAKPAAESPAEAMAKVFERTLLEMASRQTEIMAGSVEAIKAAVQSIQPDPVTVNLPEPERRRIKHFEFLYDFAGRITKAIAVYEE